MAATYPSGIRAFPTYANGDQVIPATINDPDLEITAIETGLRDGLAHDLVPDLTANQRSLGTSGAQWYNLVLSHDATIGGALHVTGAIEVTGDVTLDDVTITGEIEVTGNATFSGFTRFAGNAEVNGNFTVDSALVVGGATTLEGFTRMAVDAQVNGNFTIDGTLTVTGIAALHSGVTVDGILGVTQSVFVSEGLSAKTLTARGAASPGPTAVLQGGTGTDPVVVVKNAANTNLAVIDASGSLQVLSALVHGDVVVEGQVQALSLEVRTAIVSNAQTPTTVSTTPTTIYTAALVSGAHVGGLLLVSGTKVGDATVAFEDAILLRSSGLANAIGAITSPGGFARTYSWSGLNFQVAMAGDTYHITVLPLTMATPA